MNKNAEDKQAERRDTVLKRMLEMPPKPRKPRKIKRTGRDTENLAKKDS